MNTQEREQLNQFLNQLLGVKLTAKDDEAEHLIQEAIARQPDAAYLLVQRSLLQDQALRAAQEQIADLQQRLQQKETAASNRGFLDDNPWAPTNNNSVPGASNYRMPAAPSAPDNPAYARAMPQNQAQGFGSSFLGNVATTAAGVVAGSFLFQGIENLLGHHASPSPLSQHPTGEHLSEQTVINNYYGDSDQLAHHDDNHGAQLANFDDDNFLDDSDFDSDWV